MNRVRDFPPFWALRADYTYNSDHNCLESLVFVSASPHMVVVEKVCCTQGEGAHQRSTSHTPQGALFPACCGFVFDGRFFLVYNVTPAGSDSHEVSVAAQQRDEVR